MGALVPKRWARCAVTRNAIRRQIYAVAQIRASRLLPAAYVVRLRQGFDRTRFVSASSELLRASVRHELQQLFDRNPGAGASA
jgi:ribonuclease P protein component